MMWWLVAVTSAFLIGTGVWLILKDGLAIVWPAFMRWRNIPSRVEIDSSPTIAGAIATDELELTRPEGVPVSPPPQVAAVGKAENPKTIPISNAAQYVKHDAPTLRDERGARTALDDISNLVAGIGSEQSGHDPQFDRDPDLAARWRHVAPHVDVAVLGVNARAQSVAFEIAGPGDTGWSPGNAGYGSYRRLVVAGASVAWLRSELQAGTRLVFKVRAHQREYAVLNASVDVGAWPISDTVVTRGLVEVVRGAVIYAAWRAETPVVSAPAKAPEIVPLVVDPGQEEARLLAPSNDLKMVRSQSRQASEQHGFMDGVRTVLRTVTHGRDRRRGEVQADVLATAVGLVNGAFRDVQAHLTPVAKVEGQGADLRRAFQISFQGRPAGLVVVEDGQEAFQISVGVNDPAHLALAQRKTLQRPETGPYELAEAIATCVWPSLVMEGAGQALH